MILPPILHNEVQTIAHHLALPPQTVVAQGARLVARYHGLSQQDKHAVDALLAKVSKVS